MSGALDASESGEGWKPGEVLGSQPSFADRQLPAANAYGSVLLALDGSEAAAAGLPHAQALARSFAAPLVLLRVVRESSQTDRPAYAGSVSAEAIRIEHNALRSQAEGYLDGLGRYLRSRGYEVQTLLRIGEPAATILETAASLLSPLVVITSHGGGHASSGALLGRVAEQVLKGAIAPVFLVES
jgi:nucleotide-binding universal stress UspA family protein